MAHLMKGCLQIYCGDGKGKTTASVGLAVRAAGTGMKVYFCQVMKDGRSGEVEMLKKLGVNYHCCGERLGFFWNMTEEQKAAAARLYNQLFDEAVKTAAGEYQLDAARWNSLPVLQLLLFSFDKELEQAK